MSMSIKSMTDVKVAYEMIGVMRAVGAKSPEGQKAVQHCIDEIKREMRAYFRDSRETDGNRRIIQSDGIDGYVELVKLPERLKTVTGAEEYFEMYEVREHVQSMYDCTGRAFTRWYKVFSRQGRMWAYHAVGFDV